MENLHLLLCHRVDGLNLDCFVEITLRTSQGQIFGSAAPTETHWDVMLSMKAVGRVPQLSTTKLAAALRAIDYLILQFGRYFNS